MALPQSGVSVKVRVRVRGVACGLWYVVLTMALGTLALHPAHHTLTFLTLLHLPLPLPLTLPLHMQCSFGRHRSSNSSYRTHPPSSPTHSPTHPPTPPLTVKL